MDKHTILFLNVLMLVFGMIALSAILGLYINKGFFNIDGIPADFENWIILVLSIGSIIKIIVELKSN